MEEDFYLPWVVGRDGALPVDDAGKKGCRGATLSAGAGDLIKVGRRVTVDHGGAGGIQREWNRERRRGDAQEDERECSGGKGERSHDGQTTLFGAGRLSL